MTGSWLSSVAASIFAPFSTQSSSGPPPTPFSVLPDPFGAQLLPATDFASADPQKAQRI